MPSTRNIPAAADCIRSRKGIKVDLVILHSMDGTFDGTIAWFKTPGRALPTSAHYLTSRAGDIVQMVEDDKKAIHAGSTIKPHYNERSIAIEQEVRETKWPGKEHFPLNDWTSPMLDASALVTAAMCKKFGIPVDRSHIIGHCEVPHKATDDFHTDPNPLHFPWDDFMARVKVARAALGA